MRTEPISEHFDRKVSCCGSLEPDASLIPMTERLLEVLDHEGLAGRTVLEVGCGRGGLLVEMLRRGASEAVGLDLSPEALAATDELVSSAGLDDRCTTRVGDAADADLGVHDVVVLDRVICCYPDMTRLLANTVPAAADTYAFVVPVSAGIRGTLARVGLGFEDAIRRLRRDPFRAYVHDVDQMHRTLSDAGFRLRARSRRWMWELRAYRRDTTA